MYSLETIIAMNNRTAEKAERQGKLPRIVRGPDKIDEMPPFPFPSIGDYEPEGWTPLDIWFVDATGLGEPGEPALTVAGFKRTLKEYLVEHEEEDIGFAIIEEGEFQVHVQAFRKEG